MLGGHSEGWSRRLPLLFRSSKLRLRDLAEESNSSSSMDRMLADRSKPAGPSPTIIVARLRRLDGFPPQRNQDPRRLMTTAQQGRELVAKGASGLPRTTAGKLTTNCIGKVLSSPRNSPTAAPVAAPSAAPVAASSTVRWSCIGRANPRSCGYQTSLKSTHSKRNAANLLGRILLEWTEPWVVSANASIAGISSQRDLEYRLRLPGKIHSRSI